MISTTVKKSLNKIKFYREIELPDFASKKSIPIRHLNIGFEGKEIDVEFYMNNQFATMFFATLSVFLTYGEDLVIETARHHREFIQDPVLKQRVTSLIGQEAIHSKLHNEYNDALKDVEYPVDLYRFLGENFFKYVFLKFPQPLKLSGTVAKLAMRQPFVLFKGLTFQKLCLPGAFRPGDHHNKMLRPGLCVVHASPQYL